MEHITARMVQETVVEKVLSPPATSSGLQKPPGGLTLHAREEADESEISRVVNEVRMVKQIAIEAEPLAMLVAELAKLNVTPKRLREMAENVKRRCTFGTIAFEHWIADDVVTGEELVEERRRIRREEQKMLANIDALIDLRIEDRIRKYRVQMSDVMQNADKRTAELAAWQDRCASYRCARTAWYELASVRAKQKLARVKAQLRGMDRAARQRVWLTALQRGDAKGFDEVMIEQSHLFPDVLAGAMEEIAKEVAR